MLSLLWPEPVPVTLAGSVWYVAEFTLRDLAQLERLATGSIGAFWADLAAVESIAEAPARQEGLKALYDRALAGLPALGDGAVSFWLDSPSGKVEQLRRALRGQERPAEATLQHLALSVTPTEWAHFSRVAWAYDALDEVARVIDREIGLNPWSNRFERAGWDTALARVAKLTGWTFAQIGELTLSQWDALGRLGSEDGKKAHPYAEPPCEGLWPAGFKDWGEFDQVVNAARSRFWANGKSVSTQSKVETTLRQ